MHTIQAGKKGLTLPTHRNFRRQWTMNTGEIPKFYQSSLLSGPQAHVPGMELSVTIDTLMDCPNSLLTSATIVPPDPFPLVFSRDGSLPNNWI